MRNPHGTLLPRSDLRHMGEKKRLSIRSHGSTLSDTSRPPRCCELIPCPGSEVTTGHYPSPLPRRVSKNIQRPRSEITGHDCHLRSVFAGTLAGVGQLLRWDDTGRGIRTVYQSVPVRLLSRAVRAEKR
ncbi:hypothetical protein BS330_14595 [Amycolatopsis keratiniphila subsp. nogabecina]|uniref:Uncharacterized protein n=1 Tax=Amycolatopsis keratiniphila subsp. keratiniphila TaxID=227715 RepID=A0A1W2LSU0_9PSEU|nr:hypothetical protein BS330_14595 [Amycolatopsis keratiniphila subsp. nogabecina]ONF67920.1 hypothetical protein AVR91_0221000 [Amycolatopsis keratiniphila subsp. keratiniphila]